MKLRKNISKFQQGGQMQNVPPQVSEEQDPILQLAAMFQQGLETQDCSLLAQGAEIFLQLINQAVGETQAPVGEMPQGEPVFKKGGKIVRRRKCSTK